MSQSIFIFAGEKSGDLLGRNLIRSLKEKLPGYHISGVAGPEMRGEEIECVMRTEEFEVMGFTDVLLNYPKLRRQFYTIQDHILKTNPEATILIDYPGFNLRMAKALRKKGYKGKLIQYICPTIWAWGAKRADQMVETLDLLLTAYPFEADLFANKSLDVKYVGNPIKENVQNYVYDENWNRLFGIKNSENLVAIFPGSRRSEILLNLPYQLKAAEMLKKEKPETTFVLSCAHEQVMSTMHRLLKANSLKLNKDIFLLPKSYSYELMRECRSALAKSGTVTLELALHQKPTAVLYKLTTLNRLIAKYALKLKLPHYCIVNILSGKTVFPELIEKKLTAQTLFNEIQALHSDGSVRDECISGCKNISEILKEESASVQAAQSIKELLA